MARNDDRYPHYSRYFKPSKPCAAKGGIKAQSKRGTFGESWWAKRWNSVLESFDIGARLGRGRSYARKGQVLSIQIEKGLVRAKVQGSRPKPYDVAIQAKTLTPEDWQTVAEALAQQAIFAAKLLAGEMPQDIERTFEQCGLSLFPSQLGDLSTKCSCPDWSNPCKHIAAVYYLIGEEFDRDPFLIFTLRGLTQEELLDLLSRAARPTRTWGRPARPPSCRRRPNRSRPKRPSSGTAANCPTTCSARSRPRRSTRLCSGVSADSPSGAGPNHFRARWSRAIKPPPHEAWTPSSARSRPEYPGKSERC